MHTHPRFVLAALALLGASATTFAQQPGAPDADTALGAFEFPRRLLAGNGEPAEETPPARRPGPQDQDYSLTGMLQEAHGDFLLKHRRFEPMLRASGLWQPSTEIGSEPGDFDLTRLEFDARVPVAVSPDGYVELGGGYHVRRYEFDGAMPLRDEDLYGADVHFGLGWFAQPDVLVEAWVTPNIRSDMDGTLHGEDFNLYAGGLGTWRVREGIFVKGGVHFDETYRDVNVLPVAGISWLPVPEWRVDVLLPKYAEVSYMPDPATIFSLGVDVEGDEYRIRGPVSAGKPATDVSVQEIRLNVGARYRFNDQLSMFGRTGVAVAGDYKLRDGAGAPLADGAIDPAFFFEIGIGWTF